MQIPDQLQCLFSARIESNSDSYVVEIPEEEVELGGLEAGTSYQVALFPLEGEQSEPGEEPVESEESQIPEPPVEEGETRRVEIENLGDQGDGITRVERGFVVIVPDTKEGERVEVEIQNVQQNVAFAEVTERISYYD